MIVILVLLFSISLSFSQGFHRPLIIGHRGTAYLPELTLASQSMAHAYGADIIEIDVCLSQDNEAIVIHDIYLDAVTNVATKFPNRTRSDGLNYVLDFTLEELRQLNVNERIRPLTGAQVYSSRFPFNTSVQFHLSTLNETIELFLGLNHATGHQRQLLIEIKKPEYHRSFNRLISSKVLDILNAYDLRRINDPIILQTFHIEELIYIRQNLSSNLRLNALITSNEINESSSNYNYYRSEQGIEYLSKIVQALAPDYLLIVNYDSNGNIIGHTNLTEWAHQYNLYVYPYTFRKDLFSGNNFERLIEYFWHNVRVDGFITDHPDIIREILEKNSAIRLSIFYSFIIIIGLFDLVMSFF